MKKFGFTIAEVLITMGIIGMLAVLTVPTFVSNARKQMYSSSLVSAVADFENAMMVMMKKEGVDDLLYTRAWNALRTGRAYLLEAPLTPAAREFRNEITKILPIIGFSAGTSQYYALSGDRPLNDDRVVLFVTGQGTFYYIHVNEPLNNQPINEIQALRNNSEYLNRAAEVMIDVNGARRPNREGRDIFYYELSTDGHLYPVGSKEQCYYNNRIYVNPRIPCVTDRNGRFCAAYLRENGYQMDY